MKKKSCMTWDNYFSHIRLISHLIKISGKKYKKVYGVPRGGLMPAVMVSHSLNIPLITDHNLICNDTLICDDIVDSGGTLDNVLKEIDLYPDVAVIVENINSKVKPTYSGVKNVKDTWIVFPYEMEEDTVSLVKNEENSYE